MMSPMQNHLGQWLVSLKHYANMCLLLSSPERLPVHPQSIAFNVLAYCLVGLLAASDDYSYSRIFVGIVMQMGLLAVLAYLTLKWKNLLSRFTQTYSAMTGVVLLMDTVVILLILSLIDNPDAQSSSAVTIELFNLFWNLVVISLILKRALEVSHLASAMISFNFFAFLLITTNWMLQ